MSGSHRLAPVALLKAGDFVRHWPRVDGTKDGGRIGRGSPEYAVVVAVWPVKGSPGTQDVSIACVGQSRSNFKRKVRPYFLRYYNTSLEKLP